MGILFMIQSSALRAAVQGSWHKPCACTASSIGAIVLKWKEPAAM
jgi:hypothetical protein